MQALKLLLSSDYIPFDWLHKLDRTIAGKFQIHLVPSDSRHRSLVICPVAVGLAYMVSRGSTRANLFASLTAEVLHGTGLSKRWDRHCRQLVWMQAITLDTASESGQLQQPRTACGIPEALIKMMGRWESSAYLLYVRTPGTSCVPSLELSVSSSETVLYRTLMLV